MIYRQEAWNKKKYAKKVDLEARLRCMFFGADNRISNVARDSLALGPEYYNIATTGFKYTFLAISSFITSGYDLDQVERTAA